MAKTGSTSISRTFAWLLLLLAVIGLGGYGAVGLTMSARSVGMVGKSEISISRYQRQLTEDLRAIQAQTGLNITSAQAQQYGLDQMSLQKVVQQVALENEAARVGISVGDAEVARILAQEPAFKGFDGKFSPETYKATLQRTRTSAKEFEAELRGEGARNILDRAIAAGVRMPPAFTESLIAYLGERRNFEWAELSVADLSEPIAQPSDADLQAYHDAHADRYTIPEKRRITYAWLTPEMLAASIDVPEDELRKLYDANLAEYQTPERRMVERLVFPEEDAAILARAQLDAGETTFEDLVEARGLTLDDISLDDITKEKLGTAGDAVFAATEPGIVGPVATGLGPALFRVNAILPPQETTFDEVRDELKQTFAADQARRQIAEMYEQVKDLLADGVTLEQLVEETPLKLGTIDYWEGASDGIAGYTAFRKAAAGARVGDFLDAAALDDGGIFSLRLDAVIPPELEPLAAVRDRVIADWKAAETTKALEALADELLPRIRKGEDPASFGLVVNRENDLKRNATLADVPSGLVATAFELAKGDAARIPGTEGTGTVALVRTTDVLPADPDDPDLARLRESLPAELDSALAFDLEDAFTRAIEAHAGVRIDQQAVAAVNSQIQ